MAKEARQELAALTLGGWQRRLDQALVPHRAVWAPLVALVTLALLLTVLAQAPLHALPDYPAVGVAFLVAMVLPGLVVQRAVLPAQADLLTRLAVAPALGLALMAIPGFIALEAHTDLQEFEVLYSFFAAASCGVAVLFYRNGHEREEPDAETGRGSLLLFVVVLAVMGGVVTTPLWAWDRLSADFDDWTYMAYVDEFLSADNLNAEEPFLGTGEDVNPRMRDNVWVLSQAVVSDAAGVAPRNLLLQLEPALLAACALLAMYALTRTLFGSRSVALLAVAFEAGYGLLDLSAHEGFGRNLFLRISEDKMVSGFILFPIGLMFLSRFLGSPSRAAYAGFVLIVLALTFVHPVPLVFLATAIGSVAVLRFVMERDWRTLTSPAAVAAPVALAAIWPFIQRQLLVDVAPDLFDTEASAITFRDEFHVVDVGGGLLMGNYHMILHPLVIAAIALTPLVWLASRRTTGNQLVLAMTVGSLLVFFTPLIATPVAKLMTPQTLWKMPWMIPTAPVLAFMTFRAAAALRAWGPLRFAYGGRRLGVIVAGVAPVLAVALVLAAAVVVMDQYRRVDDKSFYDWTSRETVVPGTSESIFRGGIDRAFAGSWRLNSWDRELFAYLEAEVPPQSVVLAEPLTLNRFIPGSLTQVWPVDFGGTAGEGQRRVEAVAFARGQLSVSGLDAIVSKYSVDYIVVMEVGPATPLVTRYPGAELVQEVSAFNVYKIVR